jgi:hypothetical protein
VATITPYAMVYRGICTDILLTPVRTVLVRFDVPGVATVRVVGANGSAVERTVLVRR